MPIERMPHDASPSVKQIRARELAAFFDAMGVHHMHRRGPYMKTLETSTSVNYKDAAALLRSYADGLTEQQGGGNGNPR